MSKEDFSDEALARITDESFIEEWVNSFESDSYKVRPPKPCSNKFNLLKSCLKRYKDEHYRCKEEFFHLDDCTAEYFSNSIHKMGGDYCSHIRDLFTQSNFDSYDKVIQNEKLLEKYERCVQDNLKRNMN